MDRKQFEQWFNDTDGYKLLEEMNYFKIDLFTFKEHRSQYQHTTVQIAYMTWQHQQAKVEELKASHHGEVIGHEVHFKKIKKERDELQTLYTQQGINMLKLQKRVDAAIRLLVEAELYQSEPNIDLAVQALKGEGQ
ncbi:hypothetical protein [Acinetobacter baumannii]|uniref:hypothetical protein n=1 Tax=Acinetobacter baumannii TaxID=470 RepID=UPI00233FC75F|nr:hypothetical protein [Acinetobacter baumannii]